MKETIHARLVDGKIMYRLWSENDQCYLTDPLTYEQVIEWLQALTVYEFIRDFAGLGFGEAIRKRVDRTTNKGTSRFGDHVAINSPWEDNDNENQRISPADLMRGHSTEDAVELARAIETTKNNLQDLEMMLARLQKQHAADGGE